jgi:hypothetical protein
VRVCQTVNAHGRSWLSSAEFARADVSATDRPKRPKRRSPGALGCTLGPRVSPSLGAWLNRLLSTSPRGRPLENPVRSQCRTCRAGQGLTRARPLRANTRPHGSGSGGGANPGHSGAPHPGQGGGYNPGNGHNASGVWNGHEGEGWNPGNYYRPAVIQGWVRLGSAQTGKGADKDVIQAYGSYRYSVIKLCVRRADVKFHEARVVFARDGQQDLRLNRKVHGGSCTPNLNLRGGRRTDIRYVYLCFRQADDLLNGRTAEVDLYAR